MTIPRFFMYRYIATTTVSSIRVDHLGACCLVEKALDWDCKPSYPHIGHIYSSSGSSVNIPWPEKGMGDADYIYAFQKIVMPIAMEFAPELVISACLCNLFTSCLHLEYSLRRF
jgi:hypothetical protein